MTKKELIDKFLSSPRIAVAGVSRDNKKFGYIVYRDLIKKGYNVVPVNPNLSEIDGDKCYSSLEDIPGSLTTLFTVVKPEQTEVLLNNLRSDIKTIWMQPGSESPAAISKCEDKGLDLITGECILMYAKPNGFHNVHRFFNKIFGRLAV